MNQFENTIYRTWNHMLINSEHMNFNEYRTSDWNEAVVLKYYGDKLNCVDKTTYRAQFCFERTEETEEILREYRERMLLVEPYAFFQCSKDLKDRLYNG